MNMSDLKQQRCESCEGIGKALDANQINQWLPQLKGHWEVIDNQKLKRSFKFKNFYESMAFVNAIAWIANQENHHPDIELGYNYCHVYFFTHALQGLSLNDFICAAKINELM